MGIMYFTGAMFTYVYNRTMVTVSQGILKDIRDETLPIWKNYLFAIMIRIQLVIS